MCDYKDSEMPQMLFVLADACGTDIPRLQSIRFISAIHTYGLSVEFLRIGIGIVEQTLFMAMGKDGKVKKVGNVKEAEKNAAKPLPLPRFDYKPLPKFKGCTNC